MSYVVSVRVQGGQATAALSGDVPDGEYQISGHDDAHQRALSVVRRTPDGRYAEQAGHTHYKES